MTVKELYKLAKKNNAENKEIEITTYDDDGWYGDFNIYPERISFTSHEEKVCIYLL